MHFRTFLVFVFIFIALPHIALRAQVSETQDVFARSNLMAWCIVPFDSEKRTPKQRAEMLKELGIGKLAYDYRAEHVPTFDEEIEQLQQHGIELSAWWFPGVLNDEARLILEKLKKHKVQTQLWVTGGGAEIEPGDVEAQRRRVEQEADRIRPIANAAAQIGCSVGLYNHGGWFGNPANQLEIIEELGLPNVGIVYNLHHGHDHVAHLAELLENIKPHLMALNVNGMDPGGDQAGKKILPLGAGSLDLEWMQAIRDCGYQGPIGILNHTDEDARERLLDNLDGLEWLKQQLNGMPAGPKPKYRSWQPIPSAKKTSATPALGGGRLYDSGDETRSLPLTLVCHAKLTQKAQYNILVAQDTKASGEHWELFTQAGSGQLSVYLPGYRPDHVRSDINVCDSAPHQFVMIFEPNRVKIFVDSRLVADQAVERTAMNAVPGPLAIGRLVEDSFRCFGEIASVAVYSGVVDVADIQSKQAAKQHLIRAWQFEPESSDGGNPDAKVDSGGASSPTNSGSPSHDPKLVRHLVQNIEKGNASRGAELFASATSACLSCHRIGEFGGTVGPELSGIGRQRPIEHLLESVLWPNRLVEPKFQVTQILTVDGEQIRGYITEEDDQQITLQEPSSGRTEVVPTEDIEFRKLGPSLMPEGLVNAWTEEQQLDLLAFLSDLGHGERLRPELAASVLEHSQAHAPTPFPFDRPPMDRSASPQWEAFVNRDRIYDFYSKQAAYFRTEDRQAQLLMEFPGLDGGPDADADIGHWGNQNEQTWASNDWNEAELGRVQSGVFRGEQGLTVARGVCLQVGNQRELNVCYDPETMSFPAMWTGDFLKFSSVRHGFIHGLRPKGPSVPSDAAAGPMTSLITNAKNPDGTQNTLEQVEYLGFYRVGQRVVFALRVGGVEYLDAPWFADGQFTREVGPRETHSLRQQLLELPNETPVPIETSVRFGTQVPYAIDTIELPVENPWNMPLYCSGLDFLPDGSALIATMQGDVWHVEGFEVEEGPNAKPVWRRFASGLHQPLGLKVEADGVFVMCRDQLMRLHDLNQDGVADFHECFSNAFETSAAGHDYICGLQRDQQGNFYTASGNQGLVRIAADGRDAEVIATGFRNADGLGITADGVITVPCSEGEWTPASMICAVRTEPTSVGIEHEGQSSGVPFYGYRGAGYASLPIERPRLPLVYLPRGLDNSAGGQVYIDSDRWGPLKGNMVHLSFGAGKHFLLLYDEVDGQLQGAVVPLPGDFLSGAHRGRFSPTDGQLYVGGMAGWGSYTPRVGCFQRVRWTGEPVQLPVGFHIHENGVAIQFSEPLTSEVCRQADQHFAQAWNYRYSAAYGSAEYSTRHYGYRGHDRLQIASAHVIDDERTLFVEMPGLQVCNQLHLQLMIEPGRTVDLFATCNRLDQARRDIPGVSAEAKELADHPLDLDLLVATKKVDNPWRLPIEGARPLRIQADKNLSYDRQVLSAKPGEALALTLGNPDVVPHNWALVSPGSLRSVGEQANRMVADPEALVRQYVPQSNEVLCYTDIVDPNQEFTIYFRAPEKPGRYPYLCTFPGHWMVMNGELIVRE